jgi:superfamily I DNA/RNA helicase
MERLKDPYDAIVVDEGQDFREGWWLPLELCLADGPEGIFYVFWDDNQRIYQRAASFPALPFVVPLTENHRNTQTIHAVASHFYKGSELVAKGPAGQKVEAIRVDGAAPRAAQLAAVLARLIDAEKVEPDHIAVLVGSARSSFGKPPKAGRFHLTDDQARHPGRVLLQTIHRFKGLERPVVILVDVDDLPAAEADALFYVGLSRARVHLVVIASPATLRALGLS